MKTFVLRLFLSTTLSFFICFCFAQPGTLDSSFGVNGKVVTNASADFYGCHDVALQEDGKFIVIGNSNIDWVNPNNLIIARYLSNGNLDSTFGINGKISTVLNFGASFFIASSVVVQSDGKIIAGGSIFKGTYMTDHFVLARYLSNGNLDSSFGENGIVFTYIGPFPKENYLSSLALQKDGKILAGGSSDGYCLIRYFSNGNIDSSFAVNGILTNVGEVGLVADIKIQDDGKIITAGRVNYMDNNPNFEIVRLLSNGKVDSSFGTNGIVQTDFFGDFDQANSIELLNDGSLLTCGIAYLPDQNKNYIVLAKYFNDGYIDSAFATNGKLITQISGTYISYLGELLVQYNGKIVTTGNLASGDFLVSRFNGDGSTDSTFGTNGQTIVSFEIPSTSFSGTLQKDGKIIAVGGPDFRLARLKGDEPTTISLQKNISVTEGNTGTTPALFKVVLNKPFATDVFVNYATKNLNAIAGSDYTAALGTVRIKAGKTKANIVVNVIGDNTRETNERFALVLSNPVNAVLGTLDSVTCTIKNDDPSFALCSSTKEDMLASNKIKIYPNPVKDVLTVEGLNAAKKSTISIISSAGLILSKTTVIGNIYSSNIKQLPAGTYFVKIESSGKTETIKFIKQ